MFKIIGHSARRMQRLGFLKYLVLNASTERPTTSSFIGDNLLRAVSRKFSVPINPEIIKYCDAIFSEQHYNDLRTRIKNAAFQQQQGKIDLELQDIYLSQDRLPSKRGRILAERGKDTHVFPALASSLGFFSSDTYVLTPRGKLFASTVSSDQGNAFGLLSNINPLIISSQQMIVLLYSFLEADGDLIRMLFPAIEPRNGQFTDYEVGDIIGDLLDKYLQKVEKSLTTMQDKSTFLKLKKTTMLIKDWKGKTYKGLGARDEWATLRLEPFVDMGIFKKVDKFGYKYSFTEGGQNLVSNLETSGNMDSFLNDKYIKCVAQLLNTQISPEISSNEAIEILKESNRILANNIGYSDIIDTSILAAIRLLERGKVLEISDSIRILKEAQRNNPYDIHFNIDRWGKLKYLSFRKI